MSVRAGVVVTGTEVLTGRVADANGPWLAEALRAEGVDVGQVVVVGDRPEDMAAALAHLAAGCDLVITTGGLGPTADDLTAEVVGSFQGRPLEPDPALRERVAAIVERLARDRGWDPAHHAAGIDKQSLVPRGARVLEPTGTAPGLVVPPAGDGPPVVVLPGPPAELRAMWPDALAAPEVAAVLARGEELRQQTVRIAGPPEAELAAVLRDHEARADTTGLEVTTCLRDGELEVVTRHAPSAAERYDALVAALRSAFGAQVYSTDGRTVDDVVADALVAAGATVATAESCTGGLVAARLTERAGSSAYVLGGVVSYANSAKRDVLGVDEEVLASVGAVSREVAVAMAHGARERLGATYGVSTTGVAGPGGGTADKPVGLVHVCLAWEGGERHERLLLGGSRSHVRARTVSRVLHLLRERLAAD